MSKATAGQRLSDRQRIHWLRLIRTENVGPATFRDLINRFGSAETALEMLPELVTSGGAARLPRIPTQAEAEAELAAAARHGARLTAIGEADYPAMLRRMDQPPPIIAVKGEANVFALPAIAIVGARNASLAGIKFARNLAAELGAEGYAIVSGLARGIDTAAHQGSLATGTIAVLAGGLDHPYPPENIPLCEEICERGGAAISEMPFGWEPRAKDFPRRNRLIAGLVARPCRGRSGQPFRLADQRTARRRDGAAGVRSARLAARPARGRLEPAAQGRRDPRHRSARRARPDRADRWMRQAERQAGSPAFDAPPDFSTIPPAGDKDRARVVEALGQTPIGVDEIIRHTGLQAAHVFTILLELDLAGRLERHQGGAVSLVY